MKGGASSQGELLHYIFFDVKRRRNKDIKNLFPYNEVSNKNAFFFSDLHTGLIGDTYYYNVLKIFIYHNLSSSKRGRLLALWRQYNYVANILMITNSILLL